jgi:two-component system nitrogen regulation response regulator GlnG
VRLATPAEAQPSEEGEPGEKLPLVGRSNAMQEIYRTVARLTTADLTVMVTGESGTGKELVARALHDYGKRRQGPFVAINMAAIPRELIESELFGHERGAFTGALTRGVGRFEQAAGGTLFLDEIGDMPPEAQTRLLRVLQEGEFTTVGGRSPVKANVPHRRATHRDLRASIAPGCSARTCSTASTWCRSACRRLRERTEDIPLLARHFLDRAKAAGLPGKSLTPEAMERPEAPRLARQRARAGEPDASPRRALPAGNDRRGCGRRRAGRGGAARRGRAPLARDAGTGGGAPPQAVHGRPQGGHAHPRPA